METTLTNTADAQSTGTQITDSQSTSTDRRTFLKLMGTAGAGLTLGISLPTAALATTQATAESLAFEPNAFVRITPDNQVIIRMKHLEMGQGTYTGLATILADELDAAWEQVVPEAAPADANRYKNLAFGVQGTGGSTAIANSYMQLRQAGAAAKQMLIGAAAKEWDVPASDITITQGVVKGPNNQSTTLGALANLAAKQPVPKPESLTLKTPDQFIYIGQSMPRVDKGKSDGTATFTIDIKQPNMLTAVIAHTPRFGGKVKTVDDSKTQAMKGVVDVLTIPSGVAVLAKDFWTAKQGRDALNIEWDNTAAVSHSSADIDEALRTLLEQEGTIAKQNGDPATAFAEAESTLTATYDFPYLAHATMEPMNCVALVKEGSCELWYGAQLQTLDQAMAAGVLGIPPEKVTINTLIAGGSFGRRANPRSDYVLDAVHIAKAKPNTPIKVQWTREDDTRAGYFRPAYKHAVKVAIDKDGLPTAWQQRIVGPSIVTGTPFEPYLVKNGVDNTSVEGASTLPYAIPNLLVDTHNADLGIPVLWWRAVGHTHTAYSTETFLDVVGAVTKQDPVALRRKLLKDHPRHLGVLNLVAEKAEWGKTLPKNWSRGVSVHESFQSYVAQIAEVSMQDNGAFTVERIICAVDCGLPINPDNIIAQIEGGIGYGLSAALMGEITIDKGAVAQSNFHDYQVLRMDKMPTIEVHIVPSTEAPTGIGEPGTPPVAAAIANAIYAATGKMHYRLPMEKYAAS